MTLRGQSGKVGIGTDSPECALDVNGDIKIRATTSSNTEKGIYFRADTTFQHPKPLHIIVLY